MNSEDLALESIEAKLERIMGVKPPDDGHTFQVLSEDYARVIAKKKRGPNFKKLGLDGILICGWCGREFNGINEKLFKCPTCKATAHRGPTGMQWIPPHANTPHRKREKPLLNPNQIIVVNRNW